MLLQIALFSILHHDAHIFVLHEGLQITDDVAMFELLHQVDLFDHLLFGLLGSVLNTDFLD